MDKVAKVGDCVRVIKKLPYKDQEYNVDIGDIGVVNYVASTGKYSVHIDGKKNPHDLNSKKRQYGQLYDFWIPFSCCEVVKTKFKIEDRVIIRDSVLNLGSKTGTIKGYTRSSLMKQYLVLVDDIKPNKNREDGCMYFTEKDLKPYSKEEELTRKCLFENADALDEMKVTLDDVPDDIKELIEIGILTEEEVLAKCSNYTHKEGEETTMKEIKNQKVVDLYFERKVRELKKKLDADIKAAEDVDPHKSFVEYLRCEFNTYVENNADLNGKFKFEVTLPCTPECSKEIEKLRNMSMDEVEKVHEMKHEVLTMLSGCETYDQEMEVLKAYGIIGTDGKLVLN